VVRPRPQRRDPAGVLRRTRRAREHDPRRLDRHERRHEKAIREHAPAAEVCFDPLHVIRLAQRAVDQVRRDEWNAHERSHAPKGKWIKGTRWSLLKSPEKQTTSQLALLGEVQQANKPMFRAFLLKEELRLLYQLDDLAAGPVSVVQLR
jgi:transposase